MKKVGKNSQVTLHYLPLPLPPFQPTSFSSLFSTSLLHLPLSFFLTSPYSYHPLPFLPTSLLPLSPRPLYPCPFLLAPPFNLPPSTLYTSSLHPCRAVLPIPLSLLWEHTSTVFPQPSATRP